MRNLNQSFRNRLDCVC